MCGRYVLTRRADELVADFYVEDVVLDGPDEPNYNIAPTTPVAVVREHHPEPAARPVRELRNCHWGLVPSWAKDTSGAARMINARSETMTSKPSYRAAFARRRCLVPADGWYEWAPGASGSRRQPYYVSRQDGAVLAFAGLYEVSVRDGVPWFSCAIVTADARGPLTDIHHRMPLVLPSSSWAAWLDPDESAPVVPDPPDPVLIGLAARPVAPAVGNVRNRGPELIRPLEPVPEPVEQATLDLGLA